MEMPLPHQPIRQYPVRSGQRSCGSAVNEAPVGLQSRAVTEPAGESASKNKNHPEAGGFDFLEMLLPHRPARQRRFVPDSVRYNDPLFPSTKRFIFSRDQGLTACSILQASCSAVAGSMHMAIRQDFRTWCVLAACSAASRSVFVRQIRLSASMVK